MRLGVRQGRESVAEGTTYLGRKSGRKKTLLAVAARPPTTGCSNRVIASARFAQGWKGPVPGNIPHDEQPLDAL